MKKGDRKLFEALTLPHLDRLLAAARRRVCSVELAEDVVQDAYLNAWRSFPDLSDPSVAYQWMYRILRRLITDHYRRDARRNALVSITSLDETYEALVSTGEDEPLERLIQRLTQQRLVELLERLPEDFAEVLFMHALEGLKYSEIAEIASLPLGTVMSRSHRNTLEFAALHRELIERLDAFVDDELAPAEAERMRAHLSGCRRCQQALRLQRAHPARWRWGGRARYCLVASRSKSCSRTS